jgi:hypothetical protein
MKDHDLLRELERLAQSDATSGRARLAKVTAIRTLERLRRSRAVSHPVDDDGRFHPGPPEMWDLDRCDSDEAREAWREGLSR